jgi:hypothetical protein
LSIDSPTVQNLATDQMTNALIGPLSAHGVTTGLGALGFTECRLPGMLVGGAKAGIDAYLAQRNAATRDEVYREITLLNRSGEGVAALQEAPRISGCSQSNGSSVPSLRC